MSKEITIERSQIQSSHMPQETSFLVMSDLHYHPHVDKKIYKMILQYVMTIEPDYIMIPGDVFETDAFLEDRKSIQFMTTFFHCLGEISKVIIIPGNHDITDYNAKTFVNKNYSGQSGSVKFLASLSRISNVYFLDNEQLDISHLTFIGLNPRNETYLKREDSRINEMFIEDFLREHYHLTKENYNIVLNHNPLPLLDQEINVAIPEFAFCDLGVAGHFHNGYMPKMLSSRVEGTDIGIFTVPWISPFPGTPCRGLHPFGRGHLFVAKAVRMFGADLPLIGLLDNVSAHYMGELVVSPQKVKTR